jgi:hypothetical protein
MKYVLEDKFGGKRNSFRRSEVFSGCAGRRYETVLSNRVSDNFVGNTDCKISAEAVFILDETPAKVEEK